jgi:DNA-binding transcriptional MocR family regulator
MAERELDFSDVSVPLYRQLSAIIRDMIESGEIPPRHAVPSKTELMQRYGIGARTAKEAMLLLRDEGPDPGRAGQVVLRGAARGPARAAIRIHES